MAQMQECKIRKVMNDKWLDNHPEMWNDSNEFLYFIEIII